MPRLNRALVLSIVGDIKELVHVGNELRPWLEDEIEHLSWRFPSTFAKDVDALQIIDGHNGSAGEFYILLLEVAYDRIHFILRLIIDFLETCPSIEDHFKDDNVKRPNYMSMSNLIWMVWNRLKMIHEQATTNVAGLKDSNSRDHPKNHVTRGAQTHVTCVSHCESCSMAGETILRMINAIGAAFGENKLISAAAAERVLAKGDIYQKTQWGVMRRLADAVGTDVEQALRLMRENDLKRTSAKRDYERDVKAFRGELASTQSELDRLRDELKNGATHATNLRAENSQLEKRNDELNTSLASKSKEISDLAYSKNLLENQLSTLAENKSKLKATVAKQMEEMNDSQRAWTEKEQELLVSIADLQKRIETIERENENKLASMEEELKVARLSVSNSTSSTQTIESPLKVDKNVGCSLPISRDSGKDEGQSISGADPEADMSRQLISNREKMEDLARQNERLTKTLSRLRDYRMAGTTVNGQTK